MKKIAVIEDESDIAELITHHLKMNNYVVSVFSNGLEFTKYKRIDEFNLLILDLMLPDMDGMEICKFIRQHDDYKNMPIIMLSAKDHELDKVLGLELGADDYMTKPFSPRELIARIKSIFRRSENTTKEQSRNIITIDEHLYIDKDKHQVFSNDIPIKLTKTEFKIFSILAEQRGWVFSRDKILEYLWGNDKIVTDRTIDVHIKNLRDKLGESGKLIQNLQGIGYKLENG